MEQVKISELKARLSHYVKLVENGGEVLIKDRDRPVARLSGVARTKRRLRVIPPRYTREQAEKILAKLPKPDLSKIAPKDIRDTLRWMKKDRAAGWMGK
jgi:prevent-host-death family protein